MKNFFVGIGYDVHRFSKKRKLILAGVKIPFNKGLMGHSDADVILHSISDAILGASGSGDIGQHFPDNNPLYKNISSAQILKKSYEISKKKGYEVSNVDITVIAEQPKIANYVVQMKKNISIILGTKNINIKATTNEKLGFIGKGEGIACFSTALLTK